MHIIMRNIKLQSTQTLKTNFFLLISSNLCHKKMLELLTFPKMLHVTVICFSRYSNILGLSQEPLENGRHVCAYLNAFCMLNSNMAMKM